VGVLKHPVASYWLLVLPKKKPATSNQQQFKISRNLLNGVLNLYHEKKRILSIFFLLLKFNSTTTKFTNDGYSNTKRIGDV